jgi:hypothetical protein
LLVLVLAAAAVGEDLVASEDDGARVALRLAPRPRRGRSVGAGAGADAGAALSGSDSGTGCFLPLPIGFQPATLGPRSV